MDIITYALAKGKSGGGGGVSQIQSDWNQNDETKADYIKNKPLYKTEEGIIQIYDKKILSADGTIPVELFPNNIINNKFELWNDITLDEDVLSITVTKTDSGDSIKVKKLVLLFIGKIQSDGIFMLRNAQATIWPVYTNVKEITNNGMFWVEIEKIADGAYFSKYTESLVNVPSITDLTNIKMSGSSNRVNLVSNFAFRENDTLTNKNMESLQFGGIPSTPNCKLLSGSRILIWGIMDDEQSLY